ncbi:hypothetical protein [Sinorhizobium garamanticum]|uniref:hypothetical protein n=1 Tax=Sinorhizobium garamanticum TaxID=680247 RepID=UPI003CC8C493
MLQVDIFPPQSARLAGSDASEDHSHQERAISAGSSVENGPDLSIGRNVAANVVRCFIDGVLQSISNTNTATLPNSFDVGRASTAPDNCSWNGYLDELRVTEACRFTASFTPPAERFPAS